MIVFGPVAPRQTTATLNKKESYAVTGDPRKALSDPGSMLKMTTSRANFRAVGWTDDDMVKYANCRYCGIVTL